MNTTPPNTPRLVVDANDPRLSDPVLQRLLDGNERALSSELDNREPNWPDESPTQPHATCDTWPPEPES